MSRKLINSSLNLCYQIQRHKIDDGLRTNYLKFEGAFQPILGLAAKED